MFCVTQYVSGLTWKKQKQCHIYLPKINRNRLFPLQRQEGNTYIFFLSKIETSGKNLFRSQQKEAASRARAQSTPCYSNTPLLSSYEKYNTHVLPHICSYPAHSTRLVCIFMKIHFNCILNVSLEGKHKCTKSNLTVPSLIKMTDQNNIINNIK